MALGFQQAGTHTVQLINEHFSHRLGERVCVAMCDVLFPRKEGRQLWGDGSSS